MGSVTTKLAAAAQEKKEEQRMEDHVPEHYLKDYHSVFEKDQFDKLPERKKWDHTIELQGFEREANSCHSVEFNVFASEDPHLRSDVLLQQQNMLKTTCRSDAAASAFAEWDQSTFSSCFTPLQAVQPVKGRNIPLNPAEQRELDAFIKEHLETMRRPRNMYGHTSCITNATKDTRMHP
ncbi:hypothetical protein DFH06DRAFT_1148609 [Mycena polygramma]|nr:hypothetical protein DFH06DRAFT_1148609 [Mycena polygramma]